MHHIEIIREVNIKMNNFKNMISCQGSKNLEKVNDFTIKDGMFLRSKML